MIRIAFCQTNRLIILLKRAEKEIRFSMANGMFKIKMDIDRQGPRRIPDNCKNLNLAYFSLPSTFKPFVPPNFLANRFLPYPFKTLKLFPNEKMYYIEGGQ